MVRLQSVWFLFLLGMISLLGGRVSGETQGVKVWWTDYGSAYRLAEKERKPLLWFLKNQMHWANPRRPSVI